MSEEEQDYYRRKAKRNAADVDRLIALARSLFRGKAMDDSDDRARWYDPLFYAACGAIIGACAAVVVMAGEKLC